METETLIASYEQNKNEHIEDERMDVVPSETHNSPQKNEGGESSESIDISDKDVDQSKLRDNAGESEDCEEEQVNQDLGRIEADSDEDCEEEEKLLLSPTHSDKEYDTDEDERDHLSADENGGIEDSDEEDDKVPPKDDEVPPKDESEKCENEVEGEASQSPIQEESEQRSVTDEDDTNSKTEEKDLINNEETSETFEKAASIEETDEKVHASEEKSETAASNVETVDKIDREEATDEIAEQTATTEAADEKTASTDETDKESACDDGTEAVNEKEVDPFEKNCEVETEEKEATHDPLAAEDTSDPLETDDNVKNDEEDTISMSVDENEKKDEEIKEVEKDQEKNVEDDKEGEKDKEENTDVKKDNEEDKDVKETVLATSEKSEETEGKEKNDEMLEDTEVDKKTIEGREAEEEANKETDPIKEGTDPIKEGTDPIKEGNDPIQEGTDPIKEGTDTNAVETEGEKNLDYPLLKESLTKPVDVEKSKEFEVDEDIEMDEDFDPSLLCPELSMEVDEAPVITENDSAASENDGNKSPLRLYEPIFSTFVDEITGAEVDFQLTEEELRLREQTYGEKNPIQYTKIHCTACNVHLGSALDGQGNRFVHPLLKVLICKKCYHFYTSGEFEKDEDGSELYCRWCGQGGQVMCCSNCEMVFCKKCIRINFDRKKIAAIRDSDDWLCFRCNPSQLIHLRIHCSEFMEYVQREIGNVPSLENPAAALTTDYCQCCIPHKKRTVEPSSSEPKKKKKKVSVEVEDPDYDPLRDQETPPPPDVPSISTPVVAPTTTPAATPGQSSIGAKSAIDATRPVSTPQKMGHVPANAAFRTIGPGHQPRPRVQVMTQGQGIRPSSSPGYIKILPGGVRVPGAAANRPPTPRPPLLRPIRPTVPQMKHEWFEKTVRAAARVNSNLSYTLTQLNRAQASATSVEALAVVHNKLQEILSTSINSLIQIRKNLRTEFIAGIKNIRFPPKPQIAQQTSTSAGQDDDVIFVSPTTSPVPPPLTSPSSLPAAALNLPSSVTLTKKAVSSPSASKPGPSNVSRAGPSGMSRAGPSSVSRPGPSGTPRPGPSGLARQGSGSQPKPGPSGVSRNTPNRSDQGNGPKSFLRVKSFSALQNVTSECITIPDDPVPEEKTAETKVDYDDDDDDVTVIEKKVEIVTIIDDSPMKSPDNNIVDQPDVVKKNLAEENQSNGLTNGSEEKGEDSDNSGKVGVSIDHLDPVEKVKMLKPKILLQRSTEIDELVKSKFGLLNGDASN